MSLNRSSLLHSYTPDPVGAGPKPNVNTISLQILGNLLATFVVAQSLAHQMHFQSAMLGSLSYSLGIGRNGLKSLGLVPHAHSASSGLTLIRVMAQCGWSGCWRWREETFVTWRRWKNHPNIAFRRSSSDCKADPATKLATKSHTFLDCANIKRSRLHEPCEVQHTRWHCFDVVTSRYSSKKSLLPNTLAADWLSAIYCHMPASVCDIGPKLQSQFLGTGKHWNKHIFTPFTDQHSTEVAVCHPIWGVVTLHWSFSGYWFNHREKVSDPNDKFEHYQNWRFFRRFGNLKFKTN